MRRAQLLEAAGKALLLVLQRARLVVQGPGTHAGDFGVRLEAFQLQARGGRQRVARAPGAARDGERAQRQRAGLGAHGVPRWAACAATTAARRRA